MISLYVFFFGLIFGSFSNVLALRTHLGKSVVFPGSECPQCQKSLAWYENIPVVSFIALKGRCRSCRNRISFIYPLGELFCAALSVAIYAKFDLSLASILFFSIAVFTAPYIYIDIKIHRLPNLFTLVLAVIELGVFGIKMYQDQSFENLTGLLRDPITALIIFGVIYVLTGSKGMGMGDVKLAPVLAFAAGLIGWKTTAAYLILSFYTAGLISVGLLLSKKASRKTRIPFGPFLLLGFWIAVFLSDSQIQWIVSFWQIKH